MLLTLQNDEGLEDPGCAARSGSGFWLRGEEVFWYWLYGARKVLNCTAQGRFWLLSVKEVCRIVCVAR